MKILYDNQIFNMQQFGGISRYFTSLVFNLPKIYTVQTILPIIYSQNLYLNERLPNLKQFSNIKLFGGLSAKLISNYINSYKIRKNLKLSIENLKNQKYDLFHPTYYDTYFLNFLRGKPFVVTYYDLIHERFSHIYPEYRGETISRKKILASKAKKLIAISESTKNDLIKFLGIHPNKIEVIYIFSSIDPKQETLLKIPKKYLLFVGLRDSYKNFNFLLESIQEVLKKDSNLSLLCVGGGYFNNIEVNLIKSLGLLKKIQLYPAVTDKELVTLYKNAACLVYPSLCEGFGLPIIEAFSCGCPVVLSNVSSMPEVAQKAGVYFDPQDKNSIQQAVKDVLYSQGLRKEKIKNGFRELKKFSEELTLKKTLNFYKKVLN